MYCSRPQYWLKNKSKGQKTLGFCWAVYCLRLLFSSLENSQNLEKCKGRLCIAQFCTGSLHFMPHKENITSIITFLTYIWKCFILFIFKLDLGVRLIRWRAFSPPVCSLMKHLFASGWWVFFPFASFPEELRYFLHHQAVSGTRISQLQEVTGSLWLFHICANCNLERNKNKIAFFSSLWSQQTSLREVPEGKPTLWKYYWEYFDGYYYGYLSVHTYQEY